MENVNVIFVYFFSNFGQFIIICTVYGTMVHPIFGEMIKEIKEIKQKNRKNIVFGIDTNKKM